MPLRGKRKDHHSANRGSFLHFIKVYKSLDLNILDLFCRKAAKTLDTYAAARYILD